VSGALAAISTGFPFSNTSRSVLASAAAARRIAGNANVVASKWRPLIVTRMFGLSSPAFALPLRRLGGPRRIAHPAAEVDTAGEALNIVQGRPDRSVQIVEFYVGGDETIALVEADSGADEGTINIDNVGLPFSCFHQRQPASNTIRGYFSGKVQYADGKKISFLPSLSEGTRVVDCRPQRENQSVRRLLNRPAAAPIPTEGAGAPRPLG
jgi:hypothetical protein